MMSSRRDHLEEVFRSAIEAHEFPRAEGALHEYVTWFRSESRSLEDIRSAMVLFEWGIGVTTSHRVKVTEELMRLKRLFEAYLPGKSTETWRVVG